VVTVREVDMWVLSLFILFACVVALVIIVIIAEKDDRRSDASDTTKQIKGRIRANKKRLKRQGGR